MLYLILPWVFMVLLNMGAALWLDAGLSMSISVYIFFMQKERSLGRPRRRWEDNIKMDLREMRWLWTGLIWLRIGTSGRLL
jgi:hypothetical protein